MSYGPFASTRDPLVESAWLKWAHGVGHAQALDADIDIDMFAASPDNDPLLGVGTDYDPRRHGFTVRVADVAPVPKRWGLMLGDVAHNYRSALDHAAWTIVSRGTTPSSALNTKQRRLIQFPIADQRAAFNGSLHTRLPGARRRDIAIVRRRQPYHYSPRNRSRHYLTVLAALNNRDKHRTLQPIWVHATRLDIEIARMRDCVVPRLGWPRRRGPLEIGSEIAFIRARKRGGSRSWTSSCASPESPGSRITSASERGSFSAPCSPRSCSASSRHPPRKSSTAANSGRGSTNAARRVALGPLAGERDRPRVGLVTSHPTLLDQSHRPPARIG